jgi:hypothetical protein
MQNDINRYNPDIFKIKFQETDCYKQLCQEYQYIDFTKTVAMYTEGKTPRQQLAESRFSVVPFYFLEYLTQHSPTNIFDLGCGWNIFKKYIPNVIGIGAEQDFHFFGDLHDYVDEDYIIQHQNYFESVFSINALHFVPLSNIRKRVVDFVSMIKPGGHGFLALNLKRMLERDPTFENQSLSAVEEYVRIQLYNISAEYKVFEVDFSIVNEWLDGNIKMVIHKK